MTVVIDLGDIDFSSLGLPEFKELTSGFIREDLAALYLFDDGDTDDSITVAKDSSGNDRDASLVTGSITPTKLADGGVGTASDGAGFLFQSPVHWGASFSAVIAMRILSSPASGRYAISWENSADPTGGSIGSTNLQSGTVNGFVINHSHQSAGSSVNVNGYRSQNWASGSNSKGFNTPAANRNSWELYALSVDTVAQTILIRDSVGNEVSSTEATAITSFVAGAALFHLFGVARNSNGNISGSCGLCAIYDVAMDSDGLDEILDCARTVLAARGISV